MAEYRIVAKVDPAGATAGAAKVKQELAGISSAASATATAIERSFDQSAFDRSIGSLITRLDSLEKGLGEVVTSNGQIASSNSAVVKSLEAVASAAGRAANATSNQEKETKKAASSNSAQEAALRRVLQATDAEALALMRMNELLIDAKRLLDAGKISHEQFAAVQKLGADAANGVTTATGAQRIGMQQLGYQLGDVATMWSLGAKPAQIFGSQIGQITQAVQLMSGGTSKFAAFLGGPWGIALSVALIVLSPFVGKLLEGNNALNDAVKKLREDAKETELNRKAKEAFSKTIEGQIDAVRRLNDELDKSIRTQRQQQQITLYQAQQNVANLQKNRPGLVSQIGEQQRRLNDYNQQIMHPGAMQSEAMLGLVTVAAQAGERLKALQQQLRDVDKAIADGARGVREAQVPLIQSDVEASLDKKAAAARRYTIELARLNQQLAIGAGKQGSVQFMDQDGTFKKGQLRGIDEATYRREFTRITSEKEAAEKAAAEAERRANAAARAGDGVARYKTRQQAIGLAGRELQRGGLNVGENEQFGGVHGEHPGMGPSHGKYAIDVNSGAGVVEANVPDLKSKFDQLAKRYQARGYRVLWNGWVYEANGSGPTKAIPSGQNQHRDHMHVEAPQTIVGKATQAADASDEIRDDNAASRMAEQQRDFVSGIVDQAATRGQGNRADTVSAQIARVEAEYKRRFNVDLPTGDKTKVTKALTDADAREAANRFDDAYVKPLERLQALQGKVGQDREVMNRQLEETDRLGRALTPTEAQQIDNSVRQGEALTRQVQIAEEARASLENYRQTVAALAADLANGTINQTQFNSRMADAGSAARGILNDMPGVDPISGKEYSTIGANSDEDARYAKEQEALAANKDALLRIGTNYDSLVEQAAKRHADNLRKIDDGVRQSRLQSAQSISESLLSIAENSVGQQSGIYKALFIASKAFAIADASIKGGQALAQALSLPFPANLAALATVAASVATVVQSIQGIALNLADGGRVVGPGGPRSDSIPANLSHGEYVVNASAASRNLSLLEAINSGSTVRRTRQATNDNAALAAGNARPRVTVQQHPGVAVVTRENITTGEVEIIAQRVLETHGDRVFASALDKPNSRARKSLQRNTTARGRKS